jgi:tetratricopeptide (TPR) repeat protein
LLLQAVEYSRLLNLSQNAIAEEKEQLAEVYYYQSSYEKAKTLYNEVRSLYLTYNGDSDKKTLAANVSYGTLCVLCQDVEGGINILEKTYDMYMTYYTDSYTELISVLNNLGYAYNVRREYGKAIEYTEKCLRLIEGKDGIRNPSLITSLVNLGTYYRRSGLIEKAEQCYERALSISLQNLGYSHPKTAYVLFNQGSLEYFARQNFEKSKTLCKAAFEIRKKTLGLGHADTLFVLTFLGNEATNEGMKELAVELVQHSLREIEHEVPAPTELISILREYNLSFSQQLEKERGAKLS